MRSNNLISQSILLLAFCVNIALSFDALVTPDISPQALTLHRYLISNYDKYVLSGQTTFNYDDFVTKTSDTPLVRGFDMQNYSPHNPWFNWQPYDDGTVDKAIKWYQDTKEKGVVTFFWHWFSPKGGQLRTSTFYTNYTDFDVQKAVVPHTDEQQAIVRDFDAIAIQLKKLQQNKIPVLWRPLHEAGGKWFWWGAKTSQACKTLYSMMFKRFTEHHKINNLIWIWSTPQIQWYPGHLSVDMIGYDSYPGSMNYICREDIYYKLKAIVGERKMIVMSQNGPIPNMEECIRMGVKWGFFMGWNTLVFEQNSMEHIKQIYSSAVVKKLNLFSGDDNSVRVKQEVEVLLEQRDQQELQKRQLTRRQLLVKQKRDSL